MHASSMCISCIFAKQGKLIRQFDDEEKKSEYIHRVLEILYKHGRLESSPWLAEQINMLYESYWGNIDYPSMQIHAIVRGKDVINDATMNDAREVGLTELVPCIGNGNGAPGTVIKRFESVLFFPV